MIIGKIHDHSEVPMLTPAGKNVEREKDFLPCRDFICPEESRIREWFPDAQSGRLRAKALDPYGLMVGKLRKGDSEGNSFELNYKCQYEYCHVKITLRKITPDSEGNSYGLFGCNAHPHELPMENRSELVFANKAEAWNFFEDNWRRMYLKCGTAKNYTKFLCRRKNLGKGLGYHNCTSVFSISQTFPKEKDEKVKSLPIEDKPHSINGIFYHTHENDEKYHRHSEGGWRKQESNPTPRKKKYQPPTVRIRNGEIWPIYARKTHTVEGLLAAQEARRKDSPWLDKSKKKSVSKKKKKVVYDYN